MQLTEVNFMENDNTLHLIIGEDIPSNTLEEFDKVNLYVYDIDGILKLYVSVSLPYFINYVKFLDIEDDPRYFFYEGYDQQTKNCKHICEIKPFGTMKGIYRILDGKSFKIGNIEPLCELENNANVKKLIKNVPVFVN